MCSILLVDDDSSVLLTLSIALKRCGHGVTLAENGDRALTRLQQQKFDVVISDIRMPGMSGLQLAIEIQEMEDPPRIILTSAHYDPSLHPNPALIAEAFLQKPIDIDALCKQLEKQPRHTMLHRRHRGRTLRRVKRWSRHSLAA